MSLPALLTPRQVAELFGVCVRTVRRWRGDGKLRYTQTPGGAYRFRRSSVVELIEGPSERARELAIATSNPGASG